MKTSHLSLLLVCALCARAARGGDQTNQAACSADTLIISYGITSRSAKVAVEVARKSGKKVSALTLQTLFPVPEKAIRKALQNIKKVIVPEMNMGQYILEVQRLACGQAEIVGVNKMDTTLLSPDAILAKTGLA